MFRSIEAIFKANRGFLAKLKEIGAGTANPDPKALGDLLMTWVSMNSSAELEKQESYIMPLEG